MRACIVVVHIEVARIVMAFIVMAAENKVRSDTTITSKFKKPVRLDMCLDVCLGCVWACV